MKFTNIKKYISIMIITGALVAVCASAYTIVPPCSPVSCNTPGPVIEGSSTDRKLGALAIGKDSAPIAGSIVGEVNGGLFAEISGVLSVKTNRFLSFANTNIVGIFQTEDLTIDKFRSIAVSGACVDTSGNIVTCAVPSAPVINPITFNDSTKNGTSFNSWTVPTGVTLIKVEMWGGGGAGSNSNSSNELQGQDGTASKLTKVGETNPKVQADGGYGGRYVQIGTPTNSIGQYVLHGEVGDMKYASCYGGKGGSTYNTDGSVAGIGGLGGTVNSFTSNLSPAYTTGQDGSSYGAGGGGQGDAYASNCLNNTGPGGNGADYSMSLIPVSANDVYNIVVGEGGSYIIYHSDPPVLSAHSQNSGNGANGVVIITPNP